MSLSDALNKWAQSKEGQAKIKFAHNAAAKAGKPFGGKPAGCADHPPQFYEDEIKRLITQYASQNNHDYGEYLGRVSMRWDDGLSKWVIHLEFDPIRSRRDSWYPEGESDWGSYADGVDIVQLMNRGYEARNSVFLKDGKKTVGVSRQSYEGEFFIQAAIQEFNTLYGKDAMADYNHEKFDRTI